MKKARQILQASGKRALFARATAKALFLARRMLVRLSGSRRRCARSIVPPRPRPFAFNVPESPEVTIVLYEAFPARRLFHTLQSLSDAAPFSPPFEILALDGGDLAASRLLEASHGLTTTARSGRTLGASLNAAALRARAKFLLFLGQGTVDRSTVTTLLRAAGPARVISPQLRGPGGTAWGDPAAEYSREISVCEHSMLVETQALRAAGGFGDLDSWMECSIDLCSRLQRQGHRVLYEPKAVISGAGQPSVRTEEENSCGRRVILVIDDYVPMFDRSAGGKRMFELLKLMKMLGYHVIFVPDEGGAHEPYTSILQGLGIEVRYRWKGRSARDEIAALAPQASIVWVSRPDLCQKYLSLVRSCSRASTIYDTVDLHHRRLHTSEKITGRQSKWEQVRDLEFDLARKADRTIVTTREEQSVLAAHGITTTAVVPVIEPAAKGTHAGIEGRSGLLFVGNYTHQPNVDAAIWFCREVFPLTERHVPGVTLTLAGAEQNPRVRALARPAIRVIGHQATLREVFQRHRVFVAPLRFGAGIKGKIIEALGNGVPIVSTSVGAEGIPIEHGHNALIANTPSEFAQAIAQVYTDTALWEKLAANGTAVANAFSPESVRPLLQQALDFGASV